MRLRLAWSCIAVAGMALAVNQAEGLNRRTTRTEARVTVAASPLAFARQAAQGGLGEISLGNLALERAQHSEVRSYARRIVDDHTRAANELKTLAARRGWSLPTNLSPGHRQQRVRLSGLTGSAFDREYLRVMARDHGRELSRFRTYARAGTDADLRTWAAGKVPVLQEHLSLAHGTAATLGVRVTASR